MSEQSADDELLRTVRTRRDKVLRFDGMREDGLLVRWFVAYRGTFGWVACRHDGQWMDNPTDSDIEDALEVYDRVKLVDRSTTPEEVEL